MRKAIAIFLCLTFLASGYVRQMSYLLCRAGNTYLYASANCDCESILADSNQPDTAQLPDKHTHFHLDGSYLAPLADLAFESGIMAPTTFLSDGEHCICTGVSWPVDHPPCS